MFSLKKRTSLAQDLIQILNVTTQKISTARPFEPTDQFDSGLFVVSLRGSVYPESVFISVVFVWSAVIPTSEDLI